MSEQTMSEIHSDHFRRALSCFPSGLVVIAGVADGADVGFTCQSFYSVSLEPPLISFSVMKTSSSYPALREAGSFSVSILSHHHRDLSTQMGRKGAEKWSGVHLARTASGNPVLADSNVWLDCLLRDEYEAGDHFIVVGQVTEIHADADTVLDPLLFFQGGFRRMIADQQAGQHEGRGE